MLGKHTKVIATIGIAFFVMSVAICVIFFVIITQKKNSFHERSIERAETKARIESLDTLKKTMEATKDAREYIFSRILNEEEVIDFLALTESLGKEQGVTLTTDSLTVSPLNKTFETLDIGVTARGSYEGVMNVLRLFEQLPYQAVISGVTINNDGGEEWVSTFKVQVTKFKKI